MRWRLRLAVAAAVLPLLAACGTDGTPRGAGAGDSGSGSSTVSSSSSVYRSSATPAPSSKACEAATVAIDPGHNPERIDGFDPVTGAAQIDYPNGAEDADDFTVATRVRDRLRQAGYTVVLLKRTPRESVTYRQRVTRAEKAGADLAISVHTSPGVNAVFPQRVGLYREGAGADGKQVRLTFTNARTATASQRYARAIATGRTSVEGHSVSVMDNDFGGRAPLWSGNIPIISLISERVPWVYNEFGLSGRGGSIALPDSALDDYANGLVKGIKAALPNRGAGCR